MIAPDVNRCTAIASFNARELWEFTSVKMLSVSSKRLPITIPTIVSTTPIPKKKEKYVGSRFGGLLATM